jgi:hypothetical protein
MNINALNSSDKELIMFMVENNMITNINAEFNLAEIAKIWHNQGVKDCLEDIKNNET